MRMNAVNRLALPPGITFSQLTLSQNGDATVMSLTASAASVIVPADPTALPAAGCKFRPR